MRTKTILLYFLLLIPGFISAQKFTGNYVYSTSSLNFYPAFEPYTFDKNLEWTLRDLDLTFLTVNSGTFVLEEDETLRVENTTESTAISPLFNFGAGFQIRNPNNSRFQEVSRGFNKSALKSQDYLQRYLYDFRRRYYYPGDNRRKSTEKFPYLSTL